MNAIMLQILMWFMDSLWQTLILFNHFLLSVHCSSTVQCSSTVCSAYLPPVASLNDIVGKLILVKFFAFTVHSMESGYVEFAFLDHRNLSRSFSFAEFCSSEWTVG